MTSVTIHDHEIDSDTHNLYDITVSSAAAAAAAAAPAAAATTIRTLVTTSPAMVDVWIAETTQSNPNTPIIVGLDIEWRPNFTRNSDNPAATLQLCAGHRCLILQLIHAEPPFPTASLCSFLDNPRHSFVGVGIAKDAEKLLLDYGLDVKNTVDLGSLAAREYGDQQLKRVGLKDLARRVAGLEIAKPKRVTMGRWDYRWLNSDQIKYACIDAYASYAIGKKLIAGE